MQLPSGTWYAVRSTDIPDMIAYELHFLDETHTEKIGIHRRRVRERHTCSFEILDTSDLLSNTGPLQRFMYREQYVERGQQKGDNKRER